MFADDWSTNPAANSSLFDDGLRRSSFAFYPQSIKLEESSAIIVPSHYSPYPYHHSPPSHPPLPVQHTDDAASKETQYLRRRCFNCHTTEPPSWRRSTLNPGKIVCNKCGLYERTHLRARPLRFDELRVGGRRGPSATTAAGRSPPTNHSSVPKASTKSANVRSPGGIVKRSGSTRPVGLAPSPTGGAPMIRRTSVSSSNSSVTSDWDDSCAYAANSAFYSNLMIPPHAASIYSTTSAQSYGLQSTSPPTSRDSNSQSPPLGTESPNGVPIRIPSVPLDISTQSPHLRKAHTSPHLGFSPYASTPPPLSTSSSSSVSSLSSLSSFSATHPQQPIMNSLNPLNTYSIPPMSSLTGGMIHHPMSSLADDTYSHHQIHHSQHHYNFAPSKVWSTEPEDMGMGLGIVGLAPFVGAGSP